MLHPGTTRCASMALAVFATIGLSACAETELGVEFVEIVADESELVFTYPPVSSGFQQFFKGRDRHVGGAMYLGTWTSDRGSLPRAQMSLVLAPTGYYYPRALDAEKNIGGWEFFEGRSLAIEPQMDLTNAFGHVKANRFTADEISCVSFIEYSGVADYGVGSRQLLGYYCARPGKELSDGDISQIVKSVGVKSYGMPTEPMN